MDDFIQTKQPYSVLMSVYYKEKPDYLRLSMDSMWKQTIKPDDFVLVCDGPLNKELDNVIKEMEYIHPKTLNVIRLEKNVGLGNALNIGIKFCKHELVARMDSDDISRNYRCEKQISIFLAQPTLSIVSGMVEEFSSLPNIIDTTRVVPETQEEIINFAKKRNPFNHPCVMYRKKDVEKSGGYQDFYLLEDYYLWIRMLQKGFCGYNIQQPLLWMRSGEDMYKRRSGLKYLKSQKKLFDYMKKTGFINARQYTFSLLSRSISSVLPNFLREFLFKRYMRVKR